MASGVFEAVHIPSGKTMKVFLTHQEYSGGLDGDYIIPAYFADSKNPKPEYVKLKHLKIKK